MYVWNPLKVASRSTKFFGLNSILKNTSSRSLFTKSVIKNKFHTQSLQTSKVSTTLGLFIGATSSIVLHTRSKIFNDAVNLGTIDVKGATNDVIKYADPNKVTSRRTGRFGGKLNYKQLSYGSLTGLFFGVVIGKLSTVLGFITLSAVLLLQFLQTRGIISVPWTTIVKVGSDRIDVRHLVLEDPSFKISFALTFLIAAFNI